MKIEYKFVNGEKVDIEVYGNFEEIILELDHEFKNHERKETRRHESIGNFDDKSDVWSDKDSESVEEQIFKNFDKDKLYGAISKLKPLEQEFLHNLYLSKSPMTQEKYAQYLGIQEKSVQEKARRIRRKLENLLKNQ